MPNVIDGIRNFYRGGGALRREAVVAGGALLFGLVAMPLLIWVAGRMTLGAYSHGGALSILADFSRGLAAGELAYWFVLLGPYALLLVARGTRALAR